MPSRENRTTIPEALEETVKKVFQSSGEVITNRLEEKVLETIEETLNGLPIHGSGRHV